MGLEDRQNDQHDDLAQDAEPNSAAHLGHSSLDNVESGFHILARMIADFHVRRTDLSNCNSIDDKARDTPR